MHDQIRVLLAGCGGISGKWLSAAAAADNICITALVDINEENAEKRAAEYGLGKELVFASLETGLQKTCPDVVFDCTVPESHYEVTMQSLSAGCHVLGEKPLADSMKNAKAMVRKAAESRRIYAVMQNRRYLPSAQSFADLVKEGSIGDITTVNADFYIGAHFSGFRTRMKHPLLLDMAIHTFDQARQFSGANPQRVFCKEFNPKGSWYAGDASAMCIFEMSGGIVFNYRGSWCSEGFNTSWAGAWRIVGTRGTAIWNEDIPAAQVALPRSGQFQSDLKLLESDKPPQQIDGHRACINEFIECLQKGNTPATVCEDNIKSLAMVFGAIKSSETDGIVSIDI